MRVLASLLLVALTVTLIVFLNAVNTSEAMREEHPVLRQLNLGVVTERYLVEGK